MLDQRSFIWLTLKGISTFGKDMSCQRLTQRASAKNSNASGFLPSTMSIADSNSAQIQCLNKRVAAGKIKIANENQFISDIAGYLIEKDLLASENTHKT